jgi:hypothetical protein
MDCPSDAGFAWGRWYLAVQNTPPVTLRNGFRIRWSVVNPTTQLTCPTPSATLPAPPASDGTWTLLRDGQGVEVTLAFLEYRVFRFYSDTECTDFAASARQLERLSEGDVDLTSPTTTVETSATMRRSSTTTTRSRSAKCARRRALLDFPFTCRSKRGRAIT